MDLLLPILIIATILSGVVNTVVRMTVAHYHLRRHEAYRKQLDRAIK